MSKNTIPILMYHSISKPIKGSKMRSLSVPPGLFQKHMQILNFLGYKGVALSEIPNLLLNHKASKYVGITFDDGYLDNFENALPVLKKYGFSATCFIVTNLIGKYNSWDLSKGISQKKLMNEENILQWVKSGMEIGSHTLNHNKLTSLLESDQKKEIQNSKNFLEKKFHLNIDTFCYPYGDFDTNTVKIVKDAGYKVATSVKRGMASSEDDLHILPRIPITHRTYLPQFLIKIFTNYENKK